MDPICSALPRSDLACEDPSAGPPPTTSNLERETRAIVEAHYEALASGKPLTPDACNHFDDKKAHDFDRCITEDMSNSDLYLRGAGGASDIASTDVRQGQVGDCPLMATLSALAGTPEGRAVIHGAIVENRNDDGHVTSYTVTLHKPSPFAFLFTKFSDVKITIDPMLAVGHAQTRDAHGVLGIWSAVIEKAFAQVAGGYNTLNLGSHADVAMTLLTGKPAKAVNPATYNPNQLLSDVAAGKLVVFETQGTVADSSGLRPLHAYNVTGTVTKDGKLFVLLNNPWGTKQPAPVPYAEVGKWFSRVDIGSVR